MVKADRVEIGKDTEKPPLSAFAVVRGVELFVPMDRPRMEEELKRLQKEIVKIEKEMAFVSRKLSNEQFIAKAPAHVVEEEREKAAQYEAIRAKLEESSRKIREVLG
jgi:valyl-tRNA synthetase